MKILYSNYNRKGKYSAIIIIILILNYIKFYRYSINSNNNKSGIEERNISFYNDYITDCYKMKYYNRKVIINKNPFVSICLATYNMENYIESTILSILNQSLQDFEIIVVNDCSTDKTLDVIIKKFKSDNRIKIINHSKNLGVYSSRVDGALNSKGKYLILMDPDDMLLNPNLLEILYHYYLNYNLDIIEYKVIHYLYKSKKLFVKKNKNHYHHYRQNIIFQPELSSLLFYLPGTQKYTILRCPSIWNKIIRRKIILKTINYLGEELYKKFMITAEDTLFNIISFQFANNFSNINISGYMYNIREISQTHGKKSRQKKILFSINYLLYNKILYKYIKDFNKDRNFLFYDLKRTNRRLLELRRLNKSKSLEVNEFYKEILKDKNISNDFKKYLNIHLK